MEAIGSSPPRKGPRGEWTTPTRSRIRYMKRTGMKLREISTEIKQTYNIKIPFSTVGHICRAKVDQF